MLLLDMIFCKNSIKMWTKIVVLLLMLHFPVNCELDGWEPLGCWRDLPTRAIASLEGKSKLLGDNWKTRKNALSACAMAAKNDSLKVFAIQDGGQCFGGPYAQMFYDQYGPSNLCKGGIGGIWSNSVYSSKTSYARVLESKKDNEKRVKCSKPLDLVFLVDGSGDSSVENKLRWDQMLKFVSKATENFDPSLTRFGVVSFGSSPRVIVSLKDNKDETAMRDAIISASYPGGTRSINEALKKAWKEQLKFTERGRNKVIVALTTGNMDYGPWGSSLFLTNRGVRLLAFGIDRAPTYRFLETLASGKHPENIYSLDSEQLDESLPYFAKDICTGIKKDKTETVRKDKEIDFITSREFETVGSIVERKSEKYSKKKEKSSDKSKAVDNNDENDSKEEERKKKVHEEGNEENEERAKESETRSDEHRTNDEKGMQKENVSEKPENVSISKTNEYMKGNEEERTGEAVERKPASKHVMTEATGSEVYPVNNSSLSDGDIVEKLKENALEVLKKTKNVESLLNTKSDKNDAGIGEPIVRENSEKKIREKMEAMTDKNINNSNSPKENEQSHHDSNASHSEASKTKDYMKNTQKVVENNENAMPISMDKSHDVANNKAGQTNKSLDKGNMSIVERSDGQTTEGQMTEVKNKASSDKLNGQKGSIKETSVSTSSYQYPHKNSSIAEDNEKAGKDESKNKNLKSDHNMQQMDGEKGNETTSRSEGSDVKDSSKELRKNSTADDDGKAKKDIDNEVFMELQNERDSIGKEKDFDDNDDGLFKDSKPGDDAKSYSYESKLAEDAEHLPDDESTIDEDERVTQNALEQKKREIDILLKKLDEKRRRRRKRKVRQKSTLSDEDQSKEDFEENEMFEKSLQAGKGNEEKKIENGMEAGDENSLMPSESLGFSRSEGALKNTISDAPGHLSDRNELDRYDDIFPQEDGSKHDKVERDDKADKNARSERETAKTVERKAAENENIDYAVSPKHGLRKIVEEPKSDKKEETKSKEKKEEHENEEKRKKESDAKKANDNDHSKKNANDSSSEVKTNSENLSKNYERKNEKKQNASVDHENMKKENDNKNKEKKNKKAEKSNKEKDEDVWLFKPDETKEAYDDSESAKNATSKTEEKQANSSSILKEGNKTDDKQRQSSFNEAKVANEDSIIGEVGQALGCTRPVKVLYLIDVSDAIGTGPTRQRKWNHMKRFLRSVNDRVTHGGNLGYIVYDTEPRYISELEPCDEKTEYFVTSSECLCDRKASSYHMGRSSCSTHAPTEDENIEDWGKQGPRTAKALQLAQKMFQNESFGDAKKLVVLVTHQASTDDVTGAERSLKDDSISLVDIEIGERHNIKKRSNRFDDVIPRDHQMEVSFHKLDKAIENIFVKICKETDLTKTRRSRIFATLRRHKNWW